ncbi:MAG: hypothetical protein ACYDDN_02630 [Candidatus Desulforudaceae bacterium]|nr:hypothetical protein [Clostridia bacterium]
MPLGTDEIRAVMRATVTDKPKRKLLTWKLTWKKIEAFYDRVLARAEQAIVKDNFRWVGYAVAVFAVAFLVGQVIRYLVS